MPIRPPPEDREPGSGIDRRWLLRAALAAVIVAGLLLFTHVTERAFERVSRIDRVVDAHTGSSPAREPAAASPARR
jgi:hypothetical protein